jgi:hypothetical protein
MVRVRAVCSRNGCYAVLACAAPRAKTDTLYLDSQPHALALIDVPRSLVAKGQHSPLMERVECLEIDIV